MTPRRTSLLAWSLAGLSVIVFVAGVPLYMLTRSAGVTGTIGELLGGSLFLVFPVVGALIAARRPRNPIGWILLADGLLWNLSGMMDYYSDYGAASPGSLPFVVGMATINNWLWVPAVGLLGTYAFLLFPDGKLPSRRWLPLAWLSGVMILLVSILVGHPGAVGGSRKCAQPVGGTGAPLDGDCALRSRAAVSPVHGRLGPSLVLRYRHSRGEERQQIKWIAFGASLVGFLYLIAMIGSIVYPQETWFAPGSPPWLIVLEYAALLSFPVIPTAIGFAVLRYRLYDIDVVINRALVYGSLTATLVLIYFGGVATIQTLFRTLTGQEQQPQLAVVVSTLAIAALFNPLRRASSRSSTVASTEASTTQRRPWKFSAARLRDEIDLGSPGWRPRIRGPRDHATGTLSLWLYPADYPARHQTMPLARRTE